MKKLFSLFLILLSIYLLYGSGYGMVYAQPFDQTVNQLFPAWDTGAVDGVVGNNTDGKFLVSYVPRLIDIFLKFVAPTVFIVFLIAGIKLITSGENSEEVEKGKKVLIYTFLGVVVILLSYSITKALYFLFK